MLTIIEIKKVKHLYKIIFDSSFNSNHNNKTEEPAHTLYVTEDTLIKFILSKGTKLSPDKIQKIISFDNYSRGRNLALYYISFKIRSKAEVIKYLIEHEIPNHNIGSIIDKLEIQNFINDETYTESFINTHIATKKWGPYLIKQKLEQKGISPDLIDEKLIQLFPEDVQIKMATQLAEKLADKKTDRLPLKMLKIKLQQSLVNKGFSYSIATLAIENLKLTTDKEKDHMLIAQEAEKVYNRFSKRYEGYQLKNHITQSLARKGFDWDDISATLHDYDF